jgi:peptidoglycan/LPS O-acetylase OafA/YrhL
MVLLVHLEVYRAVPGSSAVMRYVHDLFWAGWAGVDLFFVLSGFLITGILLDAVGTERYFYSFYMRRVLRIFPLYYLMVTATLLATLIILPHLPVRLPEGYLPTPRGWLSYLFYLQNWRYSDRILSHFWSLGVEEQFYMLWPFCVCFLSRRHLLALCGSAFFACLATRFLLVQHHLYVPFIQQVTVTRMDTLLLGGFCAIAVRDVRLLTLVRRLLPAIALFSFAGMFAIDVIAREIHTRKYYTQSFGYSFLALGFAAFVLWAYLQNERGTPLDRFLQQGWLRSFGKYSYGIYVYHLSFLIAGGFLFARVSIHGMRVIPSVPYCVGIVAASFIVARLSYAIFEKRFLNMKKRFEPVPLTERAQDDSTGPGIIRQ